MNRLDSVDSAQRRTDIPDFAPGDTVRVHVRIKESETKERLQAFEGVCIARKGDEYFFALNGQVGLQRNIRNLPSSFRVMLYGFGTSENNWDSVRVVTVKQ